MDMNDRKQSEFSALNRLGEQIAKLEADGGPRTRFGRSLWISGFLAIGLVGFTLSPAGAEVGNAIRADATTVSCGAPATAPAMTTLGKVVDEDGDSVKGEAGLAALEAVPTVPAGTVPVPTLPDELDDCVTLESLDDAALAELQPSDGPLALEAAPVRIASAGEVTKVVPAPAPAPGPPAPDYPQPGPAPDYPQTGVAAPAPAPAQ
jgi:hypothetical protein